METTWTHACRGLGVPHRGQPTPLFCIMTHVCSRCSEVSERTARSWREGGTETESGKEPTRGQVGAECQGQQQVRDGDTKQTGAWVDLHRCPVVGPPGSYCSTKDVSPTSGGLSASESACALCSCHMNMVASRPYGLLRAQGALKCCS